MESFYGKAREAAHAMHTLMTVQVVIGSNKHSLGKSPSPNSITARNKSERLCAVIGMYRNFLKWAPEVSVDSTLARFNPGSMGGRDATREERFWRDVYRSGRAFPILLAALAA